MSFAPLSSETNRCASAPLSVGICRPMPASRRSPVASELADASGA
jgi:hypothetical protein